MLRLVGKVLIGVVVLLLLAVAAALALPLLLDQERFRERIERELAAATGYPVEVGGGPQVRLLPTPSVELSAVALAPSNDETPPLAAAERVRVGIDTLPLLAGRLAVRGITAEGLQASLRIGKDGRGNWQRPDAAPVFAAVSRTATPLAETDVSSAFSLPQTLLIRNAMLSVSRADGGSGPSWPLRDPGAGPTLPAGPVELLGSFQVDAPQAMLQGTWQLQAAIDHSEDSRTIRLTEMQLSGADLAAGQAQLLDIGLQAAAILHLDSGRWSIEELVLTSGPLRAHAQLAADALPAPVSGTMRIAGFDFRHWIHANGYGPLPGRPETLRCVAARSGVTFADGSLSLIGIALRVDEANAAGEARVPLRPRPLAAASVALDRIDLDAYLAQPVEHETPGGDLSGEDCAGELVASEGQPPAVPEPLGGAPFSLRIETGELRLSGLAYRRVSIDSRLAAGVVSADINAGEFYGGQLSAHVERGVGSLPTSETTVLAHASDVNIEALLKDAQGMSPVTGIGEFTAELSGSRDPALFARTLAGNVVFRVHDARFSGFDLGGALRRAGVSAEDAADATTFSTLSATAVGENGSFVTEDLSGQSALLRLDGEGVFDVAGERVQLAMRLIPITPPEGQAPRELDGVVLPVTVAGSLRQPTFEVDLNSVVRQAAGRALDKQLLEHGDTLKQIEDSLGIDNLEERLRGLLGQ